MSEERIKKRMEKIQLLKNQLKLPNGGCKDSSWMSCCHMIKFRIWRWTNWFW